MSTFAKRYESFKELLDCNADLAGILARLDAAQRGELTMEMRLVRKEARRAIVCCEHMAYCLNAISNNRHKGLEETVAALGKPVVFVACNPYRELLIPDCMTTVVWNGALMHEQLEALAEYLYARH